MLYNEYIDSLVLAEELGFDGVCVKRTSSERLWVDAITKYHRGYAGDAHKNDEDRNHRQCPADVQSANSRVRRMGDAGRDLWRLIYRWNGYWRRSGIFFLSH